MGRGRGYEYRYEFRVEDGIIPLYPNQESQSRCNKEGFVLEIRTNFKLKSRVGDGDRTVMLGSERFAVVLYKDSSADWFVQNSLSFRLKDDYWMSDDEVLSLARQAMDFAAAEAAIAVVAKLDVWTVQQEAEPIQAAIDRAIKVDDLIPIYVWPVVPKSMMRMQYKESAYMWYRCFMWALPRVRVEEDEGRIGVCCVCSRGFGVGAQMSFLPDCNHAFHSHCVFRWLKIENYCCPSCHLQIPDDAQRDYSSFDFSSG